MKEYVCLECKKPQYSASELKDLYYPKCYDTLCTGALREVDDSGLELAVLIEDLK
jgi:hypothetical protein